MCILCYDISGSVTTRDKSLSEFNEEQELSDYTQCMAWFEECKDGFIEWYGRVQNASPEDRKVSAISLVLFSPITTALFVSIQICNMKHLCSCAKKQIDNLSIVFKYSMNGIKYY